MDETSASALSNDASAPQRREPGRRWKKQEMKVWKERKKEEVNGRHRIEMKL